MNLFSSLNTHKGRFAPTFKKHPDSTWRVLHQIALGLQYLHERDIPHGNLHGDIITFSDDGFPKLGVSGLFGATNICSDNPQVNWWPHETVSSGTMSYEADMYSFGMCIIEAVTGEAPYAAAAAAGLSVKDMVMDNEVPARRHAFNDRGWELVMSLTSDNPTERVSVDTVVQELEAIAAAEEERHTAARTTYTLDQIESRLEFARKLDATQTDSIQKHLLAQLKRISDRLTSNDEIQRDPNMLSRCFIGSQSISRLEKQ